MAVELPVLRALTPCRTSAWPRLSATAACCCPGTDSHHRCSASCREEAPRTPELTSPIAVLTHLRPDPTPTDRIRPSPSSIHVTRVPVLPPRVPSAACYCRSARERASELGAPAAPPWIACLVRGLCPSPYTSSCRYLSSPSWPLPRAAPLSVAWMPRPTTLCTGQQDQVPHRPERPWVSPSSITDDRFGYTKTRTIKYHDVR